MLLRVRTDDSTREDIKGDYHKLFYTFIHLRDLFMIYEDAEPLRGYDHSLGFREIQQYDNWTLAVKGYSGTGELEFGTFLTGKKSYGNEKTILHNLYFDIKKVYRAVAKKDGDSVMEVEREIQSAIDVTYKNPNNTALAVNCEGDKPTPEEFISHIARMVQTEGNTEK